MKAIIPLAALLSVLSFAPAAAQQDISRPGTVPHQAARTGFPERVGEFRRVRVLRYDTEGRDIGANYDLVRPDGSMRLSIYVYPPRIAGRDRAQACRAEFDAVRDEMARFHGGATQPQSAEAPALPGTAPGLRYRSVHHIRSSFLTDRPEDLRSETVLYCEVAGDWIVKYRATSTLGFAIGDEVEGFIRAGPWPGRRPAEEVAALQPHGR